MTAALPRQATSRAGWRQRLLRPLPWHRRLALLASVGVLGWALSGMLHPLMTALQPQPAQLQPPREPLPLEQLLAPREVLQRAGLERAQALRLVVLDGQPWYQARLPGQPSPRYWNARSGEPADLAGRHAEALAAHYLDRSEPLAAGPLREHFDAEYAYINRLLPVMRVDTRREDGLRLYVDLFQDRLGSLVDDRKAAFGALFLQLHSFAWLREAGPWRVVLMLALLGSALLTLLLGLSAFIARRRARTLLRRLHGWGGAALALLSLGFISSAGWHLLHKATAAPATEPFAARFASEALDHAPAPGWLLPGEQLHQISLLELDGQPIWRLQGLRFGQLPTLRYVAADGRPLDDEAPRRYAEQRLAHYADALNLGAPGAMTLQRQFDHEYGFVMKRLPVLRVRYADATRTSLYLDPLDGTLAARVDERDRLEGFAFAYLHKWSFLGDWSRTGKDVLLTLAALAHVLLVLGGLWLFVRRRA